jgi:hypothetical protein
MSITGSAQETVPQNCPKYHRQNSDIFWTVFNHHILRKKVWPSTPTFDRENGQPVVKCLLASQKGMKQWVFFFFFCISKFWRIFFSYKINRICTRKTKISQFLCLKIAKSCQKRKHWYEVWRSVGMVMTRNVLFLKEFWNAS